MTTYRLKHIPTGAVSTTDDAHVADLLVATGNYKLIGKKEFKAALMAVAEKKKRRAAQQF
jgi:hypothetical protein